MKQQGETTSTVERIRGLQTDIQDLRSQNDSLKAEIEAQQAAHKAQIAAAENRAHESWLAARQTQRRFEESMAEAGALRRKLTSLSVASADGSCEYKYEWAVDHETYLLMNIVSPVHTPMDGADGVPSPIHHDPAINPGASALLMGVLPPPPFHPHAPFMGPPPPLLPPLGYMPQPPPPLLPPYGGLAGVLPPPLLPPPGEMRPPPLGRLMSPPPLPLGVGGPGSSGGRYSPMDARGHLDHRYHRGGGGGGGGGGNGRYSPDDDYAYDSDDDRHYDDHHHRAGGRRSPYDDETDFSPPPSPEPHRGYQSRDGGGGSGRQHHNPATSRSNNNNGGGNGGGVGTGSNRSHLYSPPMSTKSDTTSRSKGSRPSSRTGGGRHVTMPPASRSNARPCDSSDSMSADEYRSGAAGGGPPNAHDDGIQNAGGAARYRAATHHRPRLPNRGAYCGRDSTSSS